MKTSSYVGDVESYVAEEDGRIITGTIQDMTPYAEHAKMLRDTGQTGTKDMPHLAHFPAAAVELYCNTAGIDFREFMTNRVHVRRMMQDRDLSGFRVHEGQV